MERGGKEKSGEGKSRGDEEGCELYMRVGSESVNEF